MPTTADYLNDLIAQKSALADNLSEMGATAQSDETFNTLVPKVLEIYEKGQLSWETTIFGDYSNITSPDYGTSIFNILSNAGVNLANLPPLHTGQVQNFDNWFYHYLGTELPTLNTDNMTSAMNMFAYSPVIPTTLNTSKCTNFSHMFEGTSITSAPDLDTSKGTDFSNMFASSYITTFPNYDFSSVETMISFAENARIAGEIPKLKLKGQCYAALRYTDITKITELDLTDVSGAYSMCEGCSLLHTVNIVSDLICDGIFYGCSALANLTIAGKINISVSFATNNNLTEASLNSILSACSRTTNSDSKTLNLPYNLQSTVENSTELSALITTITASDKNFTVYYY